MNITLIVIVVIVIVGIITLCLTKNEGFNIPLRSSSAWDWNLGPGYGAGYGTGYAMWGKWPALLPNVPWKNWMWGRRPLIFKTPFTPVPQIDYNDAPDSDNKPISNYNVSLLPVGNIIKLAVNGFAGKTLQLDRGRVYFFHIYAPGTGFVIKNGDHNLFEPIEEGTIQLTFDESDPDILEYEIPGRDKSGGVIYLNSTRWI